MRTGVRQHPCRAEDPDLNDPFEVGRRKLGDRLVRAELEAIAGRGIEQVPPVELGGAAPDAALDRVFAGQVGTDDCCCSTAAANAAHYMFAILRDSPGRDDRRDRIRQSANYLRARVLSGSGEECDSSRQCIHDFRPVLTPGGPTMPASGTPPAAAATEQVGPTTRYTPAHSTAD
ncbi:MAG: hypothetical protein QOJ80_805 [Mycobacterium sp.]|jgi:hypothetical protein|nr:hypothetical protein [Mycobacterium sp.]